MDRPQYGKAILDRVANEVSGVGKVEMVPKLDGRNMIMVLAPDKKAQAAHAEDESSETPASPDAPTSSES